MDPVTSLLNSLTARGIAVEALAGGRLRVTPADALTDADRARIADAKPAMLARLTGHPTWSPTGRSWCCPCGASVLAIGWAAGLGCPFCGQPAPVRVRFDSMWHSLMVHPRSWAVDLDEGPSLTEEQRA